MDFTSFCIGAIASVIATGIFTIAYDYVRTNYMLIHRMDYDAVMIDARKNLAKLRMLEEEVTNLKWEYDALLDSTQSN